MLVCHDWLAAWFYQHTSGTKLRWEHEKDGSQLRDGSIAVVLWASVNMENLALPKRAVGWLVTGAMDELAQRHTKNDSSLSVSCARIEP